jgi:hypothetical protein
VQATGHEQQDTESDRQPEHRAAPVEVRKGVGLDVRGCPRRNDVLIDADPETASPFLFAVRL